MEVTLREDRVHSQSWPPRCWLQRGARRSHMMRPQAESHLCLMGVKVLVKIRIYR